MRAFFEANPVEVLLFYGLSFIVLGAVVFVLPKQDARLRFINHLPLIAAFGLIHGTLEFIILWKALHQPARPPLDWTAALLLFASFLPLAEFGRRLYPGCASAGPGKFLFTPWLYAVPLLAIFITTQLADDALAGFVAGTRYFVGFPGAMLTGLALMSLGQNEQQTLLSGSLRGYLRVAASCFIAYALFTLVRQSNDPALIALLPTQASFLDIFGIPVQTLRALCAMVAAWSLTHVVRRVNFENRLREIEQVRAIELANYEAGLREIEQRRNFEEELKVLAVAFETQEAVLITDACENILRVNTAFQNITGYSAAEIIGKNPRILGSGKHEPGFFKAMWAELHERGKWSGEIWNRRKNGEVFPDFLTITAVRDESGEIRHYVGTITDISQRKQAEEEIRQLALYDPLTGLPNRRLLRERLLLAFNAGMRSRSFGAVVFLDMDNFKNINDTKGHEVGDMLLVEVAGRLLHSVRESDTVARIGGDEFVLILTDLNTDAGEAAIQVEKITENILVALRRPYLLANYEHHCSASMGISLFLAQETSMDELFKRADTAMYRAKSSGKNTWRFFDPAMQAALELRMAMQAELRNAIEKNELRMYFQPQCDGEQNTIGGAEVLLRWAHPERGMIGPAEFIPLAEESGLILKIGQWVLAQACAQLKTWESSPQTSHLRLAVNVSPVQFHQLDFVETVKHTLGQSGANPKRLKLELTEGMVLDDIEGCIKKMLELKLLGVSFSIDDFGTGYSSLSYLKRLPIDQLKIDKSFIRDIASGSDDEAIVHTIIALAKSLRLEVIAEGVESEGQFALLKHNGCMAFQCYLLGRPVPLADFERQLPLTLNNTDESNSCEKTADFPDPTTPPP